jgi:hypothetical protein
MKSSLLFLSITSRLAGTGALLLLAACANDHAPRGGHDASAPPPAAAPMPEMAAHAVFFSGQIETEVLLGRGGFAPREVGRMAGGGEGERGRGGFSGGFGGGGRRGGGGGGPRGGGGEPGGDLPRSRAGGDGEPAPKIHASNAPPVKFQLRLTNHGSEPIEVEVTDFNSTLGNFVVQPRRISIPAGGSAEADPMISRLGGGGEEVPLTVALRANGKTEKQVLILRRKSPPPPAPEASSPPASAP